MTITHHPDPATLMSYAAGALAPVLAAVVASHLAGCPHCRRELRLLEMLGGAAMEELAGAALPAHAPPAVPTQAPDDAPPRSRSPDADIPEPIARLVGGDRLADIAWTRAGPGIVQRMIEVPGAKAGTLRLIKVEPGRKIPEHGHDGAEITLVLTGTYCDQTGEFRPGDVADVDAALDHEPVAGAEGCICLVANEGAPLFRGLIARAAQAISRS